MKKRTIWVIDDDLIYKTIMKKIISKSNIFSHVSTFSNGKEAIDAIKENLTNNGILPDIILLDIEMPTLDGWGFMDEFTILKPQFKSTINIYISSSSIANEDKLKAKNNPDILGYMSKPISLNDLILISSFD